MAIVKAFKGLRYNPKAAGDYQELVSPPYDKISAKLQKELLSKPNNICHIIYNDKEGEKRYQYAADCLKDWKSKSILEQSENQAIYAYSQTYEAQGETRIRWGISCVLKLEPFSKGTVIPHETTLSGPKEDRLKLLEHTKTHFGQIFMLYEDSELWVNQMVLHQTTGDPLASVYDIFGNLHQIWEITDTDIIQSFSELLENKKVFIADGHHRYETALSYSLEMKKNNPQSSELSSDYVLCTLVNMKDDKGLVILPTHRVVHPKNEISEEDFIKQVAEHFEVQPIKDLNQGLSLLAELREKKKHGLIYVGNQGKTLKSICLKNERPLYDNIFRTSSMDYRRLDVTILHTLILETLLGIDRLVLSKGSHVGYIKNAEEVVEKVEKGEFEMGFIINPTSIESMRQICLNEERMPQKSTDFYPKLLTGLVMYPCD